MYLKQNLHTHSLFCDGKNTIEDLASEAIAKDFDSIGFSSHSYTSFDGRYCMKFGSEAEYISECRRVKEKYSDKIAVFCGTERDFYSGISSEKYDYVIGSVHYVKEGDEYIPIDRSPRVIAEAIEKYYKNDVYAFVEKYYANAENIKKATDCDIIGHFDLVTVFSDMVDYIDETNPRYVAACEKALGKLVSENVIFELNSGAVARGYRSRIYPSEAILKKIFELKGKITFSSDCHDKTKLDFWFDEMASLAKRIGFVEFYVLTDNGFVPMPLD